MAVIWGSSFLLIKVALHDFTPWVITTGRITLGAITVLVIVRITGDRLPRSRTAWLHAGVTGILTNAIPFSLFAWGETHLSSVLAGIWNATTPLMTLLVTLVLLRSERPTRRLVLGMLIGFAGAVVVLGPWSGFGGGAARAHLAFAVAAACYGIGTPYMRRFLSPRPESTTSLAAAQLVVAAVALLVLAPFVTHLPAANDVAVGSALAVLGLGVLGTGIAYYLFTALVRGAGAVTAANVTYLMPIVSTTLGVVVLGETIGWNEPLGALVILVGVALA
ncbi:MAG: family transporter, partial [Thermoleophilia bacterium]|nr:family transporter [Thermoleophilia bacterium]